MCPKSTENMDTGSVVIKSFEALDILEPPKATRSHPQKMDRGYAWVIMLAVFGTSFFNATMPSVSTLLFQEYVVRFNINAATAGWVISLPSSVRFLASPLIGLSFHMFSLRTVAMAGSLIFTAGVLCTGFATHMWMLYTGSVLYGLGACMYSMSSYIIVPHYFSSKRGLAMGFTMCGFTTGQMVFPPLVSRSFITFGYTQTFIILACVSLQMLVTTSLFRPQAAALSDIEPTEEASKSKCQQFTEKTGLNLFGRPVIIYYMIVVSSINILHAVGNIFLSGLAKECTGMTTNEVATILSIAAFSSYSKLPVGLCFDVERLRAHRMYLFCTAAVGLGLGGFALTFMANKIPFAVCFILFDVAMNIVHSQYITVLGDLVRIDVLANAVALCRTFVGVTILFGPAAVGRVKDFYDSFKLGFVVVSSVHMCIVVGYIVVYFCWRRCQNRKENGT